MRQRNTWGYGHGRTPLTKFETEGSFNPGNVVVFGYSFSWTQLEALKNNLLKIAANGTNKHVLLDKRY